MKKNWVSSEMNSTPWWVTFVLLQMTTSTFLVSCGCCDFKSCVSNTTEIRSATVPQWPIWASVSNGYDFVASLKNCTFFRLTIIIAYEKKKKRLMSHTVSLKMLVFLFPTGTVVAATCFRQKPTGHVGCEWLPGISQHVVLSCKSPKDCRVYLEFGPKIACDLSWISWFYRRYRDKRLLGWPVVGDVLAKALVFLCAGKLWHERGW